MHVSLIKKVQHSGTRVVVWCVPAWRLARCSHGYLEKKTQNLRTVKTCMFCSDKWRDFLCYWTQENTPLNYQIWSQHSVCADRISADGCNGQEPALSDILSKLMWDVTASFLSFIACTDFFQSYTCYFPTPFISSFLFPFLCTSQSC